MTSSPSLALYDHQPHHQLDLTRLSQLAESALPLCLARPGQDAPLLLADCEEVEISFVDDDTIAGVHADFMSDPTPTDVITFQHGEIIISADTAARVAPEHGHSLERELGLYLIHGLLHLNGYDDLTPAAREIMHQTQAEILAQLWP
jgi:probable rRNA maturation factor